jgi:hypothetical protein
MHARRIEIFLGKAHSEERKDCEGQLRPTVDVPIFQYRPKYR